VLHETKSPCPTIRANKFNSLEQELTDTKVQMETALVTMPMFMLAVSQYSSR
jgi:hypothetical protein